ncbi:hypothetical protein UlMin_042811 [Ulmus minor]
MDSMREEEDQYFDSREDISSVSDSSSDCLENIDSDNGVMDLLPDSFRYKVWINNPGSIRGRRDKFLKWMGLGEEKIVTEDSGNELEMETNRITECSGAVLGSSSFDARLSSSQSFMSFCSNDIREFLGETLEENVFCRIRNLDNGTEFVVDELGQDGMLRGFRKVGSDHFLTFKEFESSLGLSPFVQRLMQKGIEEAHNSCVARKQLKNKWLKRLCAVACIVDRQLEAGSLNCNCSYPVARPKSHTIKVRSYRKQSKEFSALYMRQDIPAHEGSILTMKFSPDGLYLASAGEDGIVRVWQVMESESLPELDILNSDPSYTYFRRNHLSELVPLNVDREKKGKYTLGKTRVIFPQKAFQLTERPIHEFHGHCGEVLDLSWSKNQHLLSSSVDKTVRLWKVGYHQCVKVFYHNSYVTSTQFNPVDDNYFTSGSIDGKVRIWEIPAGQVVNWTDIKEIVAAVCYHPDGKEVVVGTMNGDCHFYDASDNCLQLFAQICLQRKKSPLKRITGFQFSPTDPSKLMVTSADSKVRILHGVDVVCKYRGLRNTGSQISASFTSDGARIVSASEDSNVFVWNYKNEDDPEHRTKNHWSCERFFSNNASVATTWSSMSCRNHLLSSTPEEKGSKQLRFLSRNQSATWPEEKLHPSNSLVVSSSTCKYRHKFVKSFGQNKIGYPSAWGLVIVTAGWDGRIKSFQNYGLPIQL